MKFRLLAVALLSCWLSISFASVEPIPQNPCQAGFESFKAENNSAAVEQLSKCLTTKLPAPARAYVLQLRAQSYANLKQPERALLDQKTSLDIAPPKDVWPMVMLGEYYRELKQYDLSLAALKDALKYDEDGPGTGPGMAVYYHTGRTLHSAGRYAEAVDAYTKGIPRQPDYGYVFYERGLSYEALGNKEKAKQDFVHAAELEPNEGYEREIKTKLTEYGVATKPQGH